MNQSKNRSWQQYEAGKAYKRRLGLYERVKRNEAFYRGEQWQSGEGANLPHPVFNVIHRVIEYLVASVGASDLTVRFGDEGLPFANAAEKDKINKLLKALEENTAYRWEINDMNTKISRMLSDAAISGDGVLYCYWDAERSGPCGYSGDIVTDVIDSVNVFPADVNRADIQSQDYIILSGRASVSSLRREARESGVCEEDISRIVGDEENVNGAGALACIELEGDDEAKATFIIKFWREGGFVCFEKSTRNCVIKRVKTSCRLYPIAYMNWTRAKNCFHGASPISEMIPNQKFINRAYAMAMKHMTDTAFSKVIYDKSRIPEWSNEVGEAIAAQGGGNMADAVSVVGTGEMQSGFIELINSAVTLTKELMGATESALGNMEAKNTSAIIALQETSRITLDTVRRALYSCIEQLADVWTDMMCAYYPADRLIPIKNENGLSSSSISPSLMRSCAISARVDVAEITRYSAVTAQNMLDKLLDGGHITPAEYIRRLPSGLLVDRQALIDAIESRATEHADN